MRLVVTMETVVMCGSECRLHKIEDCTASLIAMVGIACTLFQRCEGLHLSGYNNTVAAFDAAMEDNGYVRQWRLHHEHQIGSWPRQ